MRRKIWISFLALSLIGMLLPESFKMPVSGATKKDYDQRSFWYYPWGKSGTHKGVDIFSKTGTSIFSSVNGLVLYCGHIKMGGNVVVVLGPKWRIHYYAHLNEIRTSAFSFVGHSSEIGTVGTSGNAKGKSPHLHYTIATLIPYPWRVDFDHQGWKKMFYLDPVKKLNEN